MQMKFLRFLGSMVVLAITTTFSSAQPLHVSYQGELKKDGLPFTGTSQMKFVIVEDGESIWSNDGTSAAGSEPTNFVIIEAENGIFAVRLGASPMEPISGGLLKGVTEVALRVWVNTGDGFEQLTDQPISSSAFSLSGEKCLEIGELQINVVPRWDGSALVPGALFDDGNNVGVGTNAPAARLDVSGTVRSSAGFEFPDGSNQTAAVRGGGYGVPSGSMILTSNPVPPSGFVFSGLSLAAEGTGHWKTKTRMFWPKSNHILASVGGSIYSIGEIFGGYGQPLKVEVYDAVTGEWGGRPWAPSARGDFAGVSLNNLIFVIGGSNGTSNLGLVETYNTTDGNWTTRAPMPTPRRRLGAVESSGLIYALGGMIGDVFTDKVEVFDPASNSWGIAAPLPTARVGFGSACVGERIFVVGGGDSTGVLNRMDIYDTTTDTWTAGPPMSSPRTYLTVVAAGDRLFAIGGQTVGNSPPLSEVEEFNTHTSTWTLRSDLPTPLIGAAAVSQDQRIFVNGGRSTFSGGDAVHHFEYTLPVSLYAHEAE